MGFKLQSSILRKNLTFLDTWGYDMFDRIRKTLESVVALSKDVQQEFPDVLD